MPGTEPHTKPDTEPETAPHTESDAAPHAKPHTEPDASTAEAIPAGMGMPEPIASVVFLCRSRKGPHLSVHQMARAATAAFECDEPVLAIDLSKQDGGAVHGVLEIQAPPHHATGYPGRVLLQAEGRIFYAHCVSRSFLREIGGESMCREIPEPRIRKALETHGSFLRLDLVAGDAEVGDISTRGCVRQTCRLAAALLDEVAPLRKRTMALCVPQEQVLAAYSHKTRKALCEPNPLRALLQTTDHTISISPDDPEVVAASIEARQRWPEFVQAFRKLQAQARPEGDVAQDQGLCMVRAWMEAGVASEPLWIVVEKLDDGWVTGTIGSVPLEVENIEPGDAARVRISEVDDWLVCQEGKPHLGGFVLAVINRRIRAASG